MNSCKYICSFVLTSETICLDPSQYSEVHISFMPNIITSNAMRVVKLTDQYGNESYVKLTSFGNIDMWMKYIDVVTKKIFVFRPVYKINQFPGERPVLIRMYIQNPNDISENFGSVSFIRSEQAIVDLIESYKSDVIMETNVQIKKVQNFLTDNAYPISVVSCLKSPISSSRTTSNEQKVDAQKLLEYVQYGIAKFEFSESIPICNGFSFDLLNNTINNLFERQVYNSYIRASVVHGIMGCGRKRMYTCMFENIVSGSLEKISVCSSHNYYAHKVCLVLCHKKSFEKWEEELVNVNHLCISCLSDHDALTYNFVNQGGVILMDYNGLQNASTVVEEEYESMKEIIECGDLSEEVPTIKLDSKMIQKHHVNNVAKKFPSCRAPALWLHFRTVLVDDIIDMNEFDLSRADYFLGRLHHQPESNIIENIGLLSYDWGFVHVKTSGYVPTHLPIDWANVLHPIISEPQDNFYDKAPMFWKNIHRHGVIQSLQTPMSILRKVTLITFPIEISAVENEIYKKMTTLCKEISSRNLIMDDPSLTLLGKDVFGINGFNIPLCYSKSTGVFTVEDAKKTADSHFQDKNGTVAERIHNTLNNISNRVALADRLFFKTNIEKTDNKCEICFESDVEMVALCGHGFCVPCESFLTGTNVTIVNCPVCRSKLCAYDWLHLGRKTTVSNFSLTKIKILKQKIEQIGSRKRTKRTSDASGTFTNIIVLCPDNTKDVLKQCLLENMQIYEFKEFVNKFKKEDLSREIESIFMVSPSSSSELYQMIVKSYKKVLPLQLYLLYANNVESPKIALETLVTPLEVGRSGTRRKRSEN